MSSFSALSAMLRRPMIAATRINATVLQRRTRAFASTMAWNGEAEGAHLFDKVLIANRGEIACRVMRSAKSLGIRTVAVYSDADAKSMHVTMADEAYHIGPSPSRESYLRSDIILDICKRAGAQAVHPGYGFLSENATFADECSAAGIAFVGPPASAIRAMGSKSASKKIMSEAGVPVIGGYHGEDQSDDTLLAEARKIGFPVMIKAVLGGGGKGMRIVESEADFPDMLSAARNEAMKSFKDDVVLIEKYIVNPRHVEVQVFADGHGNVIHLFERDCSVQRRHQKVIEEAPAPGLRSEVQQNIGMTAVRAAKAVGYEGAGTVEFIMDRDQNFYFMEMNTRLQVEHPVTEFITGLDLVDMQLRAASGFRLPITQADVAIKGHSFEARIYAENPSNNFLPGTGPLLRLRTPLPSSSVRVETGVAEGDEVTVFYDPMIAKLVVYAEDRNAALRKLIRCLDEYEVVGLQTNIKFVRDIATHQAFVDGSVDTGFIERYYGDLFKPKPPADTSSVAQAVLVLVLRDDKINRVFRPAATDPSSPWTGGITGFRVNGTFCRTIYLTDGEDTLTVNVKYGQEQGSFNISFSLCDKNEVQVEARGSIDDDGRVNAHIGGKYFSYSSHIHDNQLSIFNVDGSMTFGIPPPDWLIEDDEDAVGSVVSPMPCKIEKVLVEPGQRVMKDTPLVILEAMKMEHVIKAPFDGVIEAVNYDAGDMVDQNQALVRFVENEA